MTESINLNSSKILIVDDNINNIKIVTKALEKIGYEVCFARSGYEALDIATQEIPDLILMDVKMPGLDGFKTCTRLKEDKLTKDIPLIFLTAHETEEEYIIKGFNVGAVDYINKPVNLDILCARVKTHTRLRTLLNFWREKAQLDPLTNLINRDGLNKILNKAVANFGICFALITVDVDFFKLYNDNYGHPAGDKCLIKIANAMKNSSTSSKQKFVSRIGGEEFSIILLGTNQSKAKSDAEHIRKVIEDLQIPHSKSKVKKIVTASIGLAVITPGTNDTIVSAFEASDRALYRAKHNGRNRVEVS